MPSPALPQIFRAPSFRIFSGEGVGNCKPCVAAFLIYLLCPLFATITLAQPPEPASNSALRDAFAHPPDDCRIMMRWWWFGPSATNSELRRELEQMKSAGIGGGAYWPLFKGLQSRLESYVHRVSERLEMSGAFVEDLGLVDTPQRGREAGIACRRADADLLVIYVTTYALSTTVLPMVQRARVPVLVLNLQPEAAIDYEAFNRLEDRTAMTGEWLAFCSACPVPEIANVLARAGIPFHQVTGVLGDESVWSETDDWIAAARVKNSVRQSHGPHGPLLQRHARHPYRPDAGGHHLWQPYRAS